VAELSAQRVRTKARNAVRRREDQIEQEEIESGELNLIPYLDIVTNLVLFLLASVTAGLILVQIDTVLPDKAPPSTSVQQPNTPNPDDQPLKMFVTVTRDRVIIWSVTGLEGTLQQPKATFQRNVLYDEHNQPKGSTGREGDPCDGPYMCESNACGQQQRCVASKEQLQPVFDFRGINGVLLEIAHRRYDGRSRKADTYQGILQADPSTPYATIISIMGAMRCRMAEFGREPGACLRGDGVTHCEQSEPGCTCQICALPGDSKAFEDYIKHTVQQDAQAQALADPSGISPDHRAFDTTRAKYDAKSMALFSDILFSSGFE
jgi:biopolymer transport protein ExbD